MSSQSVLELTDSNFDQEVLQSDVPVLVDFWAEWCAPCRMIAAAIEELADDNVGKLKVGRVDTDSNRDVPLKYGISAIPTLIVFKGGEIARKLVGLQQKAVLQQVVDEVGV